MSEYAVAKGSKLKLKGEKTKQKKKRKATEEGTSTSGGELEQRRAQELDTKSHGGWWSASEFEEINGAVAIEFGNQTYVKSMDDGQFTLGAPHRVDEPPAPEEIFTAIRINNDKIALKSGYGKYLKVERNGEIVGRSDAVGPPELWEPVFQDGKLALLGHNGCFMSVNPENDAVVATNRKAGPSEIIKLRCQLQRVTEDAGPSEERGTAKQIEINYVKKFQKFQDKRMRLAAGDREEVKTALAEGTLHEVLLDRRSKMKADRYCK